MTPYQLFKVPKYEEISVKKLWEFVKEWPDLLDYFPDYEPHQLPERFFIMGILSTLRRDEMRQLIYEARQNRSLANNDDEDQLIEMNSRIKDEIFSLVPLKSKSIEFLSTVI